MNDILYTHVMDVRVDKTKLAQAKFEPDKDV